MKFFCCFLLLIYAFRTDATCIVVYKTKSAIYIVADSKRVVIGVTADGKNHIQYKQTICKIHKQGNIYFGIAGYDDDGILKVVSNSFKGQNYSTNLMSTTTIKLMNYFYDKMEFLKKIDFKKYSQYTNKKNALASVIVFGFQKSTPYLSNIGIQLLNEDKEPIYIQKITQYSDFFVAGYTDISLASPFYKDLQNGEIINPMPILTNIVTNEISHHPDYIGYPIDKIKLTPNKEIYYTVKRCN
jgi:hypothetical protein